MRPVVVRRTGVWALLLAVLCALAGPALPAAAHATLLETDPAQGAVLETAPERVTFTFDESVLGVPSGTRVFDAAGEELAASATVRGTRLVVELEEEVGEGTLVVLWRLVSEDGHPIGGSLSFSVGAPSDVVDVPGADAGPATEAPAALGVLRGLGYVGLLVAAGVAAFSVLLLPRETPGRTRGAAARSGPAACLRDAVPDRPRARLRRVARTAAGLAALAWWAAVPVVALYQLGVPVSAVTEAGTWAALAPAEYAVPAAVTLGLATAAGALPAVAPGRARAAVVVAGCALALAAPAFTGHTRAATPEALAVGVDVLHLVAGAVWLGGLVAVVLVLGDLVHDDAGAVLLGRFSAVAAGVLAGLVVAGVVLAWRVAGSWGALVETGYGALLLVKVLVALVAVGLAAWNRYVLLPRLRAARRPRERTDPARRVVRTALAEAVVLGAVLGVTGFLVDRSPEAEQATVAGQPSAAAVTEAVRLDGVTAQVSLDPPAVGPTTVTIAMTDAAGAPFEGYAAPELALTAGDVDLGLVPLASQAPGVYAGEVVLPTSGDWDVRVSLRTTEFDNPVQTATFRVP